MNTKIELPCILHEDVRPMGIPNIKATVVNVNGDDIAKVSYFRHTSPKKVFEIPVYACSAVRWVCVLDNKQIVSEIIVRSSFPLTITTGDIQLLMQPKTLSVLPIFEFFNANGDMLYSVKFHLSSVEFCNEKNDIICKMTKAKTHKSGFKTWHLIASNDAKTLDYRLLLGYLALPLMDNGCD